MQMAEENKDGEKFYIPEIERIKELNYIFEIVREHTNVIGLLIFF